MKQYKDQNTFTVNKVSYEKVQIMLAEKKCLTEKMSVNYEAVKFINCRKATNRNCTIKVKVHLIISYNNPYIIGEIYLNYGR